MVSHIINPGAVFLMGVRVPGKYDGGRCYISYAGLEYGYDDEYQILKRLN